MTVRLDTYPVFTSGCTFKPCWLGGADFGIVLGPQFFTFLEVFDEDSTALKNLYDLFGDADGAGDAKDARLSLVELASNLTIPKLQEALLPIGNLDLNRLDPSFNGDPASVPVAKLFNMLDTDGTVTPHRRRAG